MARIRTIKPEFFTSEDIVELTPLARLFYVSLWCEADREGRLAWKPKTLKFRYLPGDDCEVESLASELEESGLISLYEVDGKAYCEIPTFTHHQVINNREKESELPPKPEKPATGKSSPFTRESHVKAEGREGREGRESDASGDAVCFEDFWQAWPKGLGEKGNKKRAESQWRKIRADGQLLMDAVEHQARAKREARESGQFAANFQHVERWLRDRGWEDELPEVESSQPEVSYF